MLSTTYNIVYLNTLLTSSRKSSLGVTSNARLRNGCLQVTGGLIFGLGLHSKLVGIQGPWDRGQVAYKPAPGEVVKPPHHQRS